MRKKRKTKGRDKIENKPQQGVSGRPPYTPSDTERSLVRTMVAGGIEHHLIADALGIDKKTLAKHYRRDLDLGATMANAQVVARVYKMTETNIRAAEFWLTNRDKKNWQHAQRVDVQADVTKNLGERLARAQAKLGKKS